MLPAIPASYQNATTVGNEISAGEARKLIPRLPAGLLDLMATALTASAGAMPRPFTCGIVNAKSGRCQENCAFCAQSAAHHTDAPVYPLISSDEMLRRAEQMAEAGIDYMGMVTSGTKPTANDFDRLCAMAKRISGAVNIRLCASFGILSRDQADALSASGFTSYHHNLETARSHYPAVCTTHEYDLRLETVKNAKAAGLRTCSGGIFGVGESWEQRLELAEELTRLRVDSIPVNFLVPVPGTPLGDSPPLSPSEALATIAILRLMHPGRDIVVCGGRKGLERYEPLLFSAGANGLMVGDYLTTKGGAPSADFSMLEALGLRP